MKSEECNHLKYEAYVWTGVMMVLAFMLYMYMNVAQNNQRVLEKVVPEMFEGKSIIYQTVNYYEKILKENNIKVDNSGVIIEGVREKINLSTIIKDAKKDAITTKDSSSIASAKSIDTFYNSTIQKTLFYRVLLDKNSIFYLLIFLFLLIMTLLWQRRNVSRSISPIK